MYTFLFTYQYFHFFRCDPWRRPRLGPTPSDDHGTAPPPRAQTSHNELAATETWSPNVTECGPGKGDTISLICDIGETAKRATEQPKRFLSISISLEYKLVPLSNKSPDGPRLFYDNTSGYATWSRQLPAQTTHLAQGRSILAS